ncbi:hypothetical protein SAMN05428961_109149 [Paenibacillus sp. OK060]|uniref:Uncharacterized protein n=1 Tax=Paenibacillus pabuli TaxID=1472 RepID=A0ABX9BGE4_9BACL|nr:hypothetical protein DET54_11164 [Paenibacillus pabuli]SDM10127.1 hypothetical protein SAMN05428961_109149 [Paenibacillus sp. OK060]
MDSDVAKYEKIPDRLIKPYPVFCYTLIYCSQKPAHHFLMKYYVASPHSLQKKHHLIWFLLSSNYGNPTC